MEELKSKYQQTLANFGKQRIDNKRLWNIGEETVKFLSLLLRMHQPRQILEIGTSNGYSTFRMLSVTSVYDGVIETIECDRERYDLAVSNLANFRNILLHFGKAEDIIPTLQNRYDFVFLDANKEQYITYLELLRPVLNHPALIVADNTVSHEHSVKRYLEAVRTDPDFYSVSIPIESGMEVSLYNPVKHKEERLEE